LKNLPQLLGADAVLAALNPCCPGDGGFPIASRSGGGGLSGFPRVHWFCRDHRRKHDGAMAAQQSGVLGIGQLLSWRKAVHLSAALGKKEDGPTDRQFAIYIAGHYRTTLTNKATWSSPYGLSLIHQAPRGDSSSRAWPTIPRPRKWKSPTPTV